VNNQNSATLTKNLCRDLNVDEELISFTDETLNLSNEIESDFSSELLKKEGIPLFEYQQEIVTQLLDTSPMKSGLLSLPTGAGKTRTALAVCLEGIANNSLKSIVWLATTMELIDQAFESAKELFKAHGDIDTIFLSKNLDDFQQHPEIPTIIFETPQRVFSDVQSKTKLPSYPDLVIFDEAHQATAETYSEAVKHLGCQSSDNPTPLIGLSATPGRAISKETEDLVKMFQERLLTAPALGNNPIAKLEELKILSKVEFKMVPVDNLPAKENVRRRLELIYKLTKRLLSQKTIEGRQKKPLIFAPSVDAAIALSTVFKATGIKAEAIHSGLEMENRRHYIKEFAEGRLDVLTNERILATGYDCPAISDVIFGTEIGSPIQFEQMVGRASRGQRTGGSKKATIWQFEDHIQLHGLPKSYRRYEDYRWE